MALLADDPGESAGFPADSPGLELEAHLSLKLAVPALRGDVTERDVAVDVQRGIGGLRMVEQVDRVHPELQALALSDPERLADGGIQTPCSRQFNDVLAQVAARSRQRIPQHDSARGIRNSVQRARSAQSRRNV